MGVGGDSIVYKELHGRPLTVVISGNVSRDYRCGFSAPLDVPASKQTADQL